MKIKTKLTLGVGLLFMLIAILAGLGAWQVHSLASDTENILVDNYHTLDYSRNMLRLLDNIHIEKKSIEKFDYYLNKQKENISEIGEAELTENLAEHFNELYLHQNDSTQLLNCRNDLYAIMKLNMDAIQRKSLLASNNAKEATLWIALTGTLCFIIAFILLINLPGNIANPIKELSESIKEIAEQNYSQRVHFEGHNEFGELAKSFNSMAQKLEEYNDSNLATLMIEKKRIETLINNMHDPVIGLDENKKIIFVNEEALKITGLKQYEVIGKSAQDISVSNDLIRSLIHELISGEVSHVQEKPFKIYANNKESYFEKEMINISIIPTGEQKKVTIGHVIILRNVTSYKELDFAKTNFIATVSHEFKTPIASIKMSLQLLDNTKIGTVNDEQRNLLNSIKDDADRLLNITGELLNMTQVETGNIQLSIIPSKPKEIVSYAINATKNQADQKHIRLDLSCPENIADVLADSEKTAWVLTNLLSNAIRYSHENSSVSILISEIKNTIQFAVTDTGQGIAPQYTEKVFDRYFRIPGTKKEGTGLGLAISKEFIEAQGGKINVLSDLGAGSTFTISLMAHKNG
jgi:NtrC-family two-component system sensor histidine kinase KinB